MRFIYVDEAGISRFDKHAVVAGIVVDADAQLIPLEEQLESLVKQFIHQHDQQGFIFHAKDIWSGTKYFKDRQIWPRESRLQILRELADIPRKMNLPIIFGYSDKEQAKKDHPAYPEKGNTFDIYCHSVAFSVCSAAIELFMRKNYPKEVAQILAENNDQARKAIREMHALYRDKSALDRIGIGNDFLPFTRIRNNILFSEKNECGPLQVADMCAFFLRGHFKRQPNTEDFYEILRPSLAIYRREDIDTGSIEHYGPVLPL